MKKFNFDGLLVLLALIVVLSGFGYISYHSSKLEKENIRLEERIKAKEGIIDALVVNQDYSYKLYLTDRGIEVWNKDYLVTEMDSTDIGKLHYVLLKDNE